MDEAIALRQVFSRRLILAMRLRGVSLVALENMTDISQTPLWEYRRGAELPRMQNLVRLCRALRVSIDYLCGLTDE